ncbi:MAG: hypothetical protein NTU81_00205 [Candidatus Nomurabacteria bacterium]|nr:hypothetical protein [Candidatus Nomurabacteria bacterium]
MKLIVSISFIVISIASFFIFTDPLYADIQKLNTEVATYNTALDNSMELQKTRDNLIEVYKNVKKEDKDNLDHLLPSTIGNIELILEIEKIANLYGMPIKNIKFDTKGLEAGIVNKDNVVVATKDPADLLPYGVFPMEFVIDGKYDTFVSFLKDIEHNLRLVDIKSISFTVPQQTTGAVAAQAGGAAGNTTNPNIYSFSLKIETYWLK